MSPRLLKNKDFWAGMMFVGFGAVAVLIARDYRFGSAMRMGPGFFPTLLGGILIAFGICILMVGLRRGEKVQERVSLRALGLLTLSLLLFGFLMERAGFIPAIGALIFMSALSGREFRFLEVVMLAGILVIAAVALFILGLGLPYSLIQGF